MKDNLTFFISSDNIPDPQLKTSFMLEDDPPTEMAVRIVTPTTVVSTGSTNVEFMVYLESYFLNCVWRDSLDPRLQLTANSGTSVSNKIYCDFYVGKRRLLRSASGLTATGSSHDLVIRRVYSAVGELASFSYYTMEGAFDSNMWFENQYTNQSEYFGKPGTFLGYMDPAAFNELTRNPIVTVKMVNNRTDDYRSPFWYNKFLTGVSYYDAARGIYDVTASGSVQNTIYYKTVSSLRVTTVGGPYYPITFYTLANPFLSSLYTGTGSIRNVSAPARGCINLTGLPGVLLTLIQHGFKGSIYNSSYLSRYSLSKGVLASDGYINSHLFARDDAYTYRYSATDDVALSVSEWADRSATVTGAGRSKLLPFPNGSYRGSPLATHPVAAEGRRSPYPFEQKLDPAIYDLMECRGGYDGSMATKILPSHAYLYCPAGDWTDDGYHVSERSLQFDLGSEQYVNKLQLVFPKSEERWQPTGVNASLLRTYTSEQSSSDSDNYPSYWINGYQATAPYGSNDRGVMRHLHTLTQGQQFLGDVGVMKLADFKFKLSSLGQDDPIAYTNQPFQVTPPDYQDASVFRVKNSTVPTMSSDPNTINPAYDFARYEYGPFLQQPTVSWMKQLEEGTGDGVNYPVAVCRRYQIPSWERDRLYSFTSLQNWGYSDRAEKALGGRLKMYSDKAYSYEFCHPPYQPLPGKYTVTSSNSSEAVNLFDYDPSTYWESTAYDENGEYTGREDISLMNTVRHLLPDQFPDGSVYTEWIQVTLPGPATMHTMTLYPYTPTSTLSKVVRITPSSGVANVTDSGIYFESDSHYSDVDGYIGSGVTVGLLDNPFERDERTFFGEHFTIEFNSLVRLNTFVYEGNINVYSPTHDQLVLLGRDDPSDDWHIVPFNANVHSVLSVDHINNPNGGSYSYRYYRFVVQLLPAYSVIEYPSNYLRVFDQRYGVEITAYIPTTAYRLDNIVLMQTLQDALTTAVRVAVGSSSPEYTVGYSTRSDGAFSISNVAGTKFYLLETDLALKLGFREFGPAYSSPLVEGTQPNTLTRSSPKPCIMTVRVSDDTVDYNPALTGLYGSNDQETWYGVSEIQADNSYDAGAWTSSSDQMTACLDEQAYKYWRLAFIKAQVNVGRVCLSRVRLTSLDYKTLNNSITTIDYPDYTEREKIYPSAYYWFFEKFNVYQIANGQPIQDYLVKEEYSFAPYFDQRDETSSFSYTGNTNSDAFSTYRPKYNTTAQKMIRKRFAQGRYVGIAPAYESVNRGYTKQYSGIRDSSADRDHKVFAWRLCHQLYNFETTGGVLPAGPQGTDGAFVKRFEYGMLTTVGITSTGRNYTTDTVQPNMGNDTETLLSGEDNRSMAATALSLLNDLSDPTAPLDTVENTTTYHRTPPPYSVDSLGAKPLPATVQGSLTDTDQVYQRYVASTKTPLERAADFTLNCVPAVPHRSAPPPTYPTNIYSKKTRR